MLAFLFSLRYILSILRNVPQDTQAYFPLRLTRFLKTGMFGVCMKYAEIRSLEKSFGDTIPREWQKKLLEGGYKVTRSYQSALRRYVLTLSKCGFLLPE